MALTFALTGATKSSAPVPPSVTVTAVLKPSTFFLVSLIVKVSELVKLGLVNKLVTVVAPPSYLNSWKSPRFGVVSAASAAVMLSSVMLNCVYKSPTDKPVPPFAGSNLKIAVLWSSCNGAATVEKLALAEL